MNSPHRIDDLVVDLSFEAAGKRGVAAPDDDTLRALVLDLMLPALDEALCAFPEDGQVWCIDAVEIDLGDVPWESIKTELPRRIKECIGRVLAQALRPDGASQEYVVTRVSKSSVDTDVMERFLQDGSLPLHVSGGTALDPEALLEALLRNGSDEFVRRLRQSPMRVAYATRLAQQFSPHVLRELLQRLAPGTVAERYLGLTEQFEQQVQAKAGSSFTQRHDMRLVWEHVLLAALYEQPSNSVLTRQIGAAAAKAGQAPRLAVIAAHIESAWVIRLAQRAPHPLSQAAAAPISLPRDAAAAQQQPGAADVAANTAASAAANIPVHSAASPIANAAAHIPTMSARSADAAKPVSVLADGARKSIAMSAAEASSQVSVPRPTAGSRDPTQALPMTAKGAGAVLGHGKGEVGTGTPIVMPSDAIAEGRAAASAKPGTRMTTAVGINGKDEEKSIAEAKGAAASLAGRLERSDAESIRHGAAGATAGAPALDGAMFAAGGNQPNLAPTAAIGQERPGAAHSVPGASNASRALNVSDPSNASGTSNASRALNVSDPSNASRALNVSDPSNASGTSNASRALNVSDPLNASGTSNASRALSVSDPSNASGTSNFSGAPDLTRPSGVAGAKHGAAVIPDARNAEPDTGAVPTPATDVAAANVVGESTDAAGSATAWAARAQAASARAIADRLSGQTTTSPTDAAAAGPARRESAMPPDQLPVAASADSGRAKPLLGQASAGKDAGANQVGADRLSVKQSMAKQSAANQSAAKHSADEQSAAKHSADEQSADGRSADKRSADRHSEERQSPDRQSANKRAEVKQVADKQSATEQAALKQAAALQAAAEQASNQQEASDEHRQSLPQVPDVAGEGVPAQIALPAMAPTRFTREGLMRALVRGDLHGRWDGVLQNQPDLLLEVVHQIGQRGDLWPRVLVKLPEVQLHDITHLVAPVAAALLRPLLASRAFYAAAGGDAVHGSHEQWVQTVRLAAFAILFDADAKATDARHFAHVLLGKVGGSSREHYVQLARAWSESLHVAGSARSLVAAVAGLGKETSAQALAGTSMPVSAQPRDLYEALVASLADARRDAGAEGLADALDIATSRDTSYLQQQLQRVRSGAIALGGERFSVVQLQNLISALLADDEHGTGAAIVPRRASTGQQSHSGPGPFRAAMLQEIAANAPQAADERRYLALVLDQLVHGRVLDLEAIVAATASAVSQAEAEVLQPAAILGSSNRTASAGSKATSTIGTIAGTGISTGTGMSDGFAAIPGTLTPAAAAAAATVATATTPAVVATDASAAAGTDTSAASVTASAASISAQPTGKGNEIEAMELRSAIASALASGSDDAILTLALKSGRPASSEFAGDVAAMAGLVAALVRADRVGGGIDRSAMFDAVITHAKRIGATVAYFRHILDDLVQGRLLDLDAADRRAASNARTARMSAETGAAPLVESSMATPDLYQVLLDSLGAAVRARGAAAMTIELDRATSTAGPRLQQWLRQLREGKLLLGGDRFTTLQIKNLIKVQIDSGELPQGAQSSASPFRASMLQAIEQHAALVTDQHRYHKLVLEQLVHGRLLDLAAISARIEKAPVAAVLNSKTEYASEPTAAPAAKIELTGAELRERIASTFATGNRADLARFAETLPPLLDADFGAAVTAEAVALYRLVEAYVLAGQAKGAKRRNVMLESIRDKARSSKRADIVLGRVLADLIAGRAVDLEAAQAAVDAAKPAEVTTEPESANAGRQLHDGAAAGETDSVSPSVVPPIEASPAVKGGTSQMARDGASPPGKHDGAGPQTELDGANPQAKRDNASPQAKPAEASQQAKPAEQSQQAKPAEQRQQAMPAEQNQQAKPADASLPAKPAVLQHVVAQAAKAPSAMPQESQFGATPDSPQHVAPPESLQNAAPPEARQSIAPAGVPQATASPAVPPHVASPEAPQPVARPEAAQYVAPPEAPIVQSLAGSADAVARLLQAFATGDFADLYMVWEQVLAGDGEHLRLALRGLDPATVPWSEVADGFPQSVLDDVVALLSPRAVEPLAAWIEDEVLNEIADDAILDVPRPQRMQRMRVAAIIHVLQLGDGALDESIFVAVLAAAMADSQPATVARLMAAWTGEGQSADSAGQPLATPTRSQARAARAALESVLAELKLALELGSDAALRPALKRLSQQQLSDVLSGLANAAGSNAADTAPLPQAPAASSLPQPAATSVQQQAAAASGQQQMAFATSLQQLAAAILRADAASDGHDRSMLRDAIDSHAMACSDPQGFMIEVLDDLINDRIVDLETISARFAANGELSASGELLTNGAQRNDGEQSVTGAQPVRVKRPAVSEKHKLIETILPGRAMPMRTHHAGWIERALAAHPPAVRASLSALLHQADPSAMSVQSLSQDLVQKIVRQLAGSQADAMLRCAFDVAQTFMEAYPETRHTEVSAMQWQYLFVHLFELRRGIDMARLAAGLSDYLLLRHGRMPTERMKQLVRRRFGVEVTGEKERAPAAAAERTVVAEAVPEEGESIYIGNAGQVLAAPYMPRLFSMVGLLEGGRFKDAEAAERAVHLMQLVVTGKTDAPEYQLGLNKILCGVGSGTPIVREIEATEQEKEVVEALIKGMIGHWTAIGNTSVAGLRETFLQRAGALYFKDDAWQLKVQAGPIDMLLDRLPWSFSIIKHPWMERSVHVTWR